MSLSVLNQIPRTTDRREQAAWRRAIGRRLVPVVQETVRTNGSGNVPILTLTLGVLSSTLFEFFLVGRQFAGTGGTIGDGAAWSGYACYKMSVATATKVGSEVITLQGADNVNVTTGITQGDNQVQWVVNGDTNTEYEWLITVRSLKVGL